MYSQTLLPFAPTVSTRIPRPRAPRKEARRTPVQQSLPALFAGHRASAPVEPDVAEDTTWRYDTSNLALDDPILSPSGDDAEAETTAYTPFRIYSQNVSGLKLNPGNEFVTHVADFLEDFGAGVACLSETNKK